MSDPMFVMSKYLSVQDLYEAKAKYYMEKSTKQQAKIKELIKQLWMAEAQLENAEGYLWDASDASQWEDYINGVPHLKSEYTKEGEDDE